MDKWERFNETSLLEKEEFHSNLNMEKTADAGYNHAKEVCKDFEMKYLDEYHDLYLKRDTLLLADVFKRFKKMCFVIYETDPAIFFSIPELSWKAALKKIKVELELFTDTVMLLIAEKGIRDGIRHAIHWYVKANDKYIKNCNKNKESSDLKYWYVNNLYGWANLKKLPVDGFE